MKIRAVLLFLSSGMFLTGVIGKPVSGYDVPECRWRNAVIDATGSSASMLTTSAPGAEPSEVTSWHSTCEAPILPALNRFRASVCMSIHVSAEAKTGIPSFPERKAALSA